jgi:IS30 family transposase
MNDVVWKYPPKGTEFAVYSQEALNAIADEINNCQRKSLGVPQHLSFCRELRAISQQHFNFESKQF